VDIFPLLDAFRSVIFCVAFIIPDLAVHFNRAAAEKMAARRRKRLSALTLSRRHAIIRNNDELRVGRHSRGGLLHLSSAKGVQARFI